MLRLFLVLLFVFPILAEAVSFTQYPTSTNTSGTFTLAWQALPADTQSFKVQELKGGVKTRVVASSGTSVVVSGLSSGTYTYQLWVVRRYFNSQMGEWVRENTVHHTISVTVSVSIPPPGKPTAPSISNNGGYTVSWLPVTGATSYKLEEKINNNAWGQVQNSTSLSKAYSSKAAGTYQYRVRACIGGSNCSGYSAIASVHVVYPPAAPTITSSSSQITYSYTGTVRVAWNPASTATRYQLEQLSGSSWANKVNANQLSISLLNYSLGSYSFRVKACNSGGCSPWSATKVISLSQAPNISGATTSRGTVSLTWIQPGPANYVNLTENNVLIATFSPASDGKTITFNRQNGTYRYAMRSCIQIDGGTDNCQPYGLVHTVQVLTVPSFLVSATAGTGGSITPASTNVLEGSTTSFTLTAESGYKISAATGCGGTLVESVYTTAVITGSCSVSASFTPLEVPGSPSYVTQFNYDARGRLVKIGDDSGKEIVYTLDDAGNRTAMIESAVTPDVTSFNAPTSVVKGALATVSWTSVNTTHCTLAIFGDTSGYQYLPISGSQSVRIYQPTGVSVKCYAGEQYDSAGKIIGISGGGPID